MLGRVRCSAANIKGEWPYSLASAPQQILMPSCVKSSMIVLTTVYILSIYKSIHYALRSDWLEAKVVITVFHKLATDSNVI
jgi:uncharacterized membrane protein